MEFSNKEIGARIRALRLSRHMTQTCLAGDSITRNMLSLIENGYASPSLSTLTELAARLEVPVGYFFASDDTEISQFIKMSMISEIRRLYSDGDFTECLQLCTSLSRPDDEIHMLISECSLALAHTACLNGTLASAFTYLDKAEDSARHCVYQAVSLYSTVHFIRQLINSVKSPEIPRELGNSGHFPQSRIPAEFFAYITALCRLEENDTSSTTAIISSGLIQTSLYLDFISANILLLDDDTERAGASLRRILAAPSIGFFTHFHALNAMEKCARLSEDYKTAYQFSTQKVHLLEQFSK